MSNVEQDEIAKAALIKRYERAMHAMQSGVAYEISSGKHAGATPKHLRVGINSCMVETSLLAKILMEKKIVTELEYFEGLAQAAEAEQKRYEDFNGVKFA